nr:V-type proton ATPase subunit a1-like [Tanacetum cinerariifolium]
FVSSGCFRLWSSISTDESDKGFLFGLIKRDCKENSNIFSQGIELRGIAIHICTFLEGDQIDSGAMYILIEQEGPKEDLCMIAFQPQGVSVWEGAEAVHLQAEETKMEYSSRSPKIFSRILDFIQQTMSNPMFFDQPRPLDKVKRFAEMSKKRCFFKDQIPKAGLISSGIPTVQPDVDLEELE